MNAILAPLVGDAPSVTVVGLCKNAGKTTALCRLLKELDGETVAVTSIGRDGERTDVVTGTEKPEIWVRRGTLFATAAGLLPLCDVTCQVLDITPVSTPLGPVAILRAQSDGFIQLAGPSAASQLPQLTEQFRRFGASRVLIDGAAGRRSLASAAEEGCAILCVGAALEGGAAALAAETAHVCRLFDAPLPPTPALRDALTAVEGRFALFTPEGDPLPLPLDDRSEPIWSALPAVPAVLWVSGGVTDGLLKTLSGRGIPLILAVPDPTHLLCGRTETDRFLRLGGGFWVLHRRTVAAVCANPWSPYGKHLDRDELLAALRSAVDLPVIDAKEDLP